VRGNVIEQFVMSCRVIGLDVEIAALCKVMKEMWSEKLPTICGLFTKTDANLLCRDVFKRCGFSEQDGVWTWAGNVLPSGPEHVESS
jgi:predicted enzyme involved in methoxymalonyl-ACP biosynthesis